METKSVVIGGGVVLATLLVFPIVYSNWPRDPDPEVDGPVLAEIQAAIGQYRKDFGELPKKLKDLTPEYFQEIPQASNREPFEYDPKTGRVAPPYSMTPERVELFKGLDLPSGSGSPMGEVMTGIGIRNELNY